MRVVGDGSERDSLEAWTASRDVPGITFASWAKSVPDELANAGILLAPAIAEPFGLAVVEAMAAGVPVVASAAGGHLESVGQLVDSPMFPPRDKASAATLLRSLLSERARAALSASGRELVAQEFSIARHVEALLVEYEHINISASDTRRTRVVHRASTEGSSGKLGLHPSDQRADAATNWRPSVRTIAFYLPQYYPIAENDEWWGKGFTEWTNVVRWRPLFRGHTSRHLPSDLGFYDLRVPEIREAQAALAEQYGVTAFCYWHYWFAGRQILNRPFDEVLASGEPSLPFCLAWANQTWSGTWHGAPERILIEQTYPGQHDDESHFNRVLAAFSDPRYLTVDGKPLFYVYRPEQLPDAASWVERWRNLADRAGLPGIYLVAEVSDLLGKGPVYDSVKADGWDAGVYLRFPALLTPSSVLRMRIRRALFGGPEIYPYAEMPHRPGGDLASLLPAVHPNWDNTPRAGRNGLVLDGATPRAFRRHVEEAVSRVSRRPSEERLVFVKSWNEWAEGNHLEPDMDHGHAWLQALRDGLGKAPSRRMRSNGLGSEGDVELALRER